MDGSQDTADRDRDGGIHFRPVRAASLELRQIGGPSSLVLPRGAVAQLAIGTHWRCIWIKLPCFCARSPGQGNSEWTRRPF
jgi:hypothetical protein